MCISHGCAVVSGSIHILNLAGVDMPYLSDLHTHKGQSHVITERHFDQHLNILLFCTAHEHHESWTHEKWFTNSESVNQDVQPDSLYVIHLNDSVRASQWVIITEVNTEVRTLECFCDMNTKHSFSAKVHLLRQADLRSDVQVAHSMLTALGCGLHYWPLLVGNRKDMFRVLIAAGCAQRIKSGVCYLCSLHHVCRHTRLDGVRWTGVWHWIIWVGWSIYIYTEAERQPSQII